MENLCRKNILITGCTGSIGSAIFDNLVSNTHNNNIYITGRNRDKIIKLTKNGFKNNNQIFSGNFDLKETNNIQSLISDVRDKLKSVDILINCAGVFSPKKIELIDNDEIIETLYVNFASAYILSREFIKEMKEKNWGRIVNVGSSSAYYGFKNNTLYSSTKHALLGFSKSLHDEVKNCGVRVSCLSPSSTKGEMGKKTPNQNYETFLEPNEVAEFILFVINFNKNLTIEDVLLKRMEIS